MKVGMSETDRVRHYYYEQILPSGKSYYIRFCDWLASATPVVIMPDVLPDCKRCIKKQMAKDT